MQHCIEKHNKETKYSFYKFARNGYDAHSPGTFQEVFGIMLAHPRPKLPIFSEAEFLGIPIIPAPGLDLATLKFVEKALKNTPSFLRKEHIVLDHTKFVIPVTIDLGDGLINNFNETVPARAIPTVPFAQRYMEKFGWNGGPLREGGLDKPLEHASQDYGFYRLGIGASLDTEIRDFKFSDFQKGEGLSGSCFEELSYDNSGKRTTKFRYSRTYWDLLLNSLIEEIVEHDFFFGFIPPKTYAPMTHRSAPPYYGLEEVLLSELEFRKFVAIPLMYPRRVSGCSVARCC